MPNKKVKIVVTGGHHTTAFALLDELGKHCDLEVIWFGHKYSMWGDKSVSAEYTEVKNRGYDFVNLRAGKFYKTFNPLKLLRIPFGFFTAFGYLAKARPQLILSFGGYLAVPTVIAGWALRIPAVTHEQTTTVGFANRFVAYFVKKVFISWPESSKYFPEHKVILTGNPVRLAVFECSEERDREFSSSFSLDKRVIYVTGGKQGAHVINEAVKFSLADLLKKYNVIHQCGQSSAYQDYEDLLEIKKELPPDLSSRYLVRPFFSESEIGSIYHVADLVISRAGANTIYELMLLGKPSLLIPIPWLPRDEQTNNAEVLVSAGLGEILLQKDLTGESLLSAIDSLNEKYESYKESADDACNIVIKDAAENMVSHLLSLFPWLIG